ncbi:MAG TPA: hypothetical protein VLC48_02910, partial [Gemmatimonadota bacterium]|nr:hypothetical protein [Gemmatimonadota bacterium]
MIGLLAAGLLGVRSLRGLSAEFEQEMSQMRQVAEIGNQLQRDVLELILTGNSYLTDGEPEAKERFQALATRAQDRASRYRELESLLANDALLVEQLMSTLTQLEVDYSRAHALYDVNRRTEARRLADEAQPLVEGLMLVVTELGGRRNNVLAESTTRLRNRARSRATYVLLITLLAAAIGVT